MAATEALHVLISKEAQPCTIKSFRPINLCNVSLKLVYKMIVNTIKEIWKCIISTFQASIVPGRQSINNIMLRQEFIHSLRQSKFKKGGIIIKLDLEKAYNRVE